MSAQSAMPPCLVPGLGVLTGVITPELVDEVVDRAGCRERRWRLLPARVVVYLVLGMCLLSGEDSLGPPGYRSVMRSLSHGVRHVAGLAVPSASALCQARARLGSMVFELLWERLAGPLAARGEPGCFALGLRAVAWDATSVALASSAANAARVGRHRNQHGESGPPLFRLLALIECGTHAVIDAVFDAFAVVPEHALARGVLASLRPGMLLLADRNFPGHQLWSLAAATGAQLCWRVPGTLSLDVAQRLADGSWISVLHDPGARPAHARRARRLLRERGVMPAGAAVVRVIAYQVTVTSEDGQSRTEHCRLITTILDPHRAPAEALAALYHERWECEGHYRDLKARLKGAGFTLRSRTPELTAQEMLAFLCVAQALAVLARNAAATAGTDPGRVSFTVTIRIARDHARALTPAGLATATACAITDILADLLPPRRQRQCPREQKRRTTPFPKGKDPDRPPSTVTYAITIKGPPPSAST